MAANDLMGLPDALLQEYVHRQYVYWGLGWAVLILVPLFGVWAYLATCKHAGEGYAGKDEREGGFMVMCFCTALGAVIGTTTLVWTWANLVSPRIGLWNALR